jgi:hypothetical protein
MKDNLEVHEFSLKRIVENLSKIPSRGKLMEGFSEEVKKLTPQQKKNLMEKIANYNQHGKVLQCETAIKELVNTFEEITTMAESYAMTEASDFFQQEVIQRDYKQLKGINKDFKKLAQECYGKLMQLNALYEDGGKMLERYFEIKSLDEVSMAVGKPMQDEIVGDEIQSTIPKDDVKPQDEPLEGGPVS